MGFRKNRHEEIFLPPHLRIVVQRAAEEAAKAAEVQQEEKVTVVETVSAMADKPETILVSTPTVAVAAPIAEEPTNQELKVTTSEALDEPVLKNALKSLPYNQKKKKIVREKKNNNTKKTAVSEQPKKD